jgi:hypothetical protein
MSANMKLSEAIRIGSLERPQAIGNFFRLVGVGESSVIGSCAWGAAYEAVTGYCPSLDSDGDIPDEDFHSIEDLLETEFPLEYELLFMQITEMNDSGKHTREEIADFLEREGL